MKPISLLPVPPGSKRAKYLFARMRLAVIVAGVRKERN